MNSGFIPAHLVDNEVRWFYENLGLDDLYFVNEAAETVCGHVIALYAYKLTTFIDNKRTSTVTWQRKAKLMQCRFTAAMSNSLDAAS